MGQKLIHGLKPLGTVFATWWSMFGGHVSEGYSFFIRFLKPGVCDILVLCDAVCCVMVVCCVRALVHV